ncbi:hypothetical protein ACFX2A_047590 [Malus domestica]
MEHNRLVWEGKFTEPLEVLQRVLCWLQEFQEVNCSPSHVKEPQPHRWMTPSEGWFKLNVHGAAKLEVKDGGAGGVLRGDGGLFRATGVLRFQGICSVK